MFCVKKDNFGRVFHAYVTKYAKFLFSKVSQGQGHILIMYIFDYIIIKSIIITLFPESFTII